MAKKQVKKKYAPKIVVYSILDPNADTFSSICFSSKAELLEYIEDNVLDVLRPGESDSYKIGVTQMTETKFMNLKDIDD